MRRLKRFFISLHAALTGALAVGAGVALARGADAVTWSGVLLANLPPFAFIALAMLLKPAARTSASLPVLTTLTTAGAALAVVGSARADGTGFLPPFLAGLGVTSHLVYVYWYSDLGRTRSDHVRVGRRLPDLAFESATGQRVPLEALLGRPTLLLFYRGNWCPLCMAQIREVARDYRSLHERGVTVALISPQPASHTASIAQKFDVPFQFLRDPDNRCARTLGIADEHGLPLGLEILGYEEETVLPTIIITDAEGVILYEDQTDNYRVRPEPQTFVEALERAGVIDPQPS